MCKRARTRPCARPHKQQNQRGRVAMEHKSTAGSHAAGCC